MHRQAIDKTSSELFSDSKVYVILAFYCCVFAIVKSARNAYTGLRTLVSDAYHDLRAEVIYRVQVVHYRAVCAYRRRTRELFVFTNSLSLSFSGSLVAIQLYLT